VFVRFLLIIFLFVINAIAIHEAFFLKN